MYTRHVHIYLGNDSFQGQVLLSYTGTWYIDE